ncbi:hypothetical protein ACJMK2_038591 [Sinanodonta woodiana]|uniref:EF-hand domain-containing protein n=1 Tax=Sinanodonta woodiana TaxID=1069815 RepID=A0ABD3WCR4_SINWO
MLGSAIFGCFVVAVLGQNTVSLPHGHKLTDIVDKGFQYLDTNHDGVLQLDEANRVFHLEDANGDGVLTLAEFVTFMNAYGGTGLAETIFNHYDTDRDGRLNGDHMNQYLMMMDTNHDGMVTRHEYDMYETHLLTSLFGHQNHGR